MLDLELSLPMSSVKTELVCWNVRGLGSTARKHVLREFVEATRAAIYCIQESKLEIVTAYTVLQCFGPLYDAFAFLPACATRGGIIIAWDSSRIQVSNLARDANFLLGYVVPVCGPGWWLSVVYGPQEDAEKIRCLEELAERRLLCPGPWLAIGDYNLILNASDKSNTSIDRRMMGRFWCFVDVHGLKEMFLHGCQFTWSNERQNPTLTKIYKALVSIDLELEHPDAIL